MNILRYRVVEPGWFIDGIYGARLSYGSQDHMDSHFTTDGAVIGPQDEQFIKDKLLTDRGARGEDKLLRTLFVSAFIRAPLRWWVEADTYKIAPPEGAQAAVSSLAVRQSSSLMHRLARHGALTADDFTATTDPRLIDLANEHYQAWVDSGAKRNFTSPEWVRFQDAIGRGFLYTSQWVGNYAILRNLYAQRSHHRMGEWRTFCAWVETLPFSWLITWRDRRD